LLDYRDERTFTEYAAFGDLTTHITDRFDIQVGGRQSRNKQHASTIQSGPFAGPPSGGSSQDSSFTYLLTPRFKLSPDLMLYARLASGYRPGGFNALIAGQTDAPPSYAPDKTYTYEIGTKADLLDHTLSFDASLYYIKWNNVQTFQYTPVNANGYTGNGGDAKSEGVEVAVNSKPWTGGTISAWVAFNNAELTNAFPPLSAAYGVAGDRLPYSSRFSGDLSIDQEFPVAGSVTGFVMSSISYTGERKGVFTSSPQRQSLPAYARTDVRAGLRYESWTTNIFVTNVADKRGVLTGGLGTTFPSEFTYIQPRTVGLSLSWSF
jgi:iron complex outermembrane recepter protein